MNPRLGTPAGASGHALIPKSHGPQGISLNAARRRRSPVCKWPLLLYLPSQHLQQNLPIPLELRGSDAGDRAKLLQGLGANTGELAQGAVVENGVGGTPCCLE